MNDIDYLESEIEYYKTQCELKEMLLESYRFMYEVQVGKIAKLKLLLKEEGKLVGLPMYDSDKENTIIIESKMNDENFIEDWYPEKGSPLNP